VISVETVALVGGLSGGVLGTWLQIRHEREEAFRERLITAADEFSTHLLQAIIGLDEARSACVKHGFITTGSQITIRDEAGKIPSEIEEALQRSRALITEARARSGRVSLLISCRWCRRSSLSHRRRLRPPVARPR
jgi:hypothetical protein